jgi:hypothetical protein
MYREERPGAIQGQGDSPRRRFPCTVGRFRAATHFPPTAFARRTVRPMKTARIEQTLSILTPEEMRDALWFIDLCENRTMSTLEADEWRRRIRDRTGR